jgi:hypothetical protein
MVAATNMDKEQYEHAARSPEIAGGRAANGPYCT